MFAKVISATLKGIEGIPVRVETDLSPGLPAFLLVGLPGTTIREAADRIHIAITNAGYPFPEKKITVNLAPANLRKEGTQFDLPIALGILAADGKIPPVMLKKTAFLGELSLDGKINSVRGALPLAAGLRKKGIRRIFLPEGNAEEVSLLDDMEIHPVRTFSQLVETMRDGVLAEPFRKEQEAEPEEQDLPDFGDVRGQEAAKRAFEVAAAGNHAILMTGSPGSGKTLMARCLPGILPPMDLEEQLEVTMIYSVAGELKNAGGFLKNRPFREPHHTIPIAALIGGGTNPKPGEISLAHKGVLFLDEFPEYDRHVIEALREPLESRKVDITRLADSVRYPADFLLVAASNPCPCGYYGDREVACTCSSGEIRRYRAKLSGPIMDRIDLQIAVNRISFTDLSESGADRTDGTGTEKADETGIRKRNEIGTGKVNETGTEKTDETGTKEKEENARKKTKWKTTAEMRSEVEKAVSVQMERYKGRKIRRNSELSARDIKIFCPVSPEGERLLGEAFNRLHLSARGYGKVLKVARTIADLEGKETIEAAHIAEALRYRITL